MALPLLLRQTGWSSRGVSYSQLNGQLGGPVGVDVYACRLLAGLEITEEDDEDEEEEEEAEVAFAVLLGQGAEVAAEASRASSSI